MSKIKRYAAAEMYDKDIDDFISGQGSVCLSSDVEALEQRIQELEGFIKSNCYDVPGEAARRAMELLNIR